MDHTYFFFFFNDTATTEIYTLSLHDALPIFHRQRSGKLCINVQAMRNSSATLVLLVLILGASSCSRAPKRDFPLVQKYTTQAGDLFYFRPHDGPFALLERRKALAVRLRQSPRLKPTPTT